MRKRKKEEEEKLFVYLTSKAAATIAIVASAEDGVRCFFYLDVFNESEREQLVLLFAEWSGMELFFCYSYIKFVWQIKTDRLKN